jgi:hypothetical protein
MDATDAAEPSPGDVDDLSGGQPVRWVRLCGGVRICRDERGLVVPFRRSSSLSVIAIRESAGAWSTWPVLEVRQYRSREMGRTRQAISPT